MDAATMQLIVALLPLAENLIFTIGGQMVKIATSNLTTPEAVAQALADAKASGFPQLTFVVPAVPAIPVAAPVAAPLAVAAPVAAPGAVDEGVADASVSAVDLSLAPAASVTDAGAAEVQQ